MNRRQRRKILSDKGKEWSEESAAIMELFRQWLIISGLKKTEFLNRVDGGFFKIFFHRGDMPMGTGWRKFFFKMKVGRSESRSSGGRTAG